MGVTQHNVTQPVQEFEDKNQDGLPDKLTQFLTNSDFRSDWNNRRKVIFYSLIGKGALFVLIILALLWVVLIDHHPIDPTLAGLISTAMWVLSIAFVTIAGTYIFGAQFDVNSFRSSVVSIVQTTHNKPQQPQ